LELLRAPVSDEQERRSRFPLYEPKDLPPGLLSPRDPSCRGDRQDSRGPQPGPSKFSAYLQICSALPSELPGWPKPGRLPSRPGYFLPTVAGGLVGAFAAAQVHFHSVAEASFGIGVLCWGLLGSLVLNRLFFRPRLAGALFPTMAIELAPPAVAGVAYFAITGGATGPVAEALAGYAVLMALVQLRLLPIYARLRFTPGNWAFTFSYAAAATDALDWTALKRPPGAATYATAVIAFITMFILAIGVRTGVAVARRQFLPKISVAGNIKETP